VEKKESQAPNKAKEETASTLRKSKIH